MVCHKDHDNGYEDYIGKCLLCEVERLRKREWVGLTDDEAWSCWNWEDFQSTWKSMEAKLKDKNCG